jgi:hypothetical protein
VSQACCSVWISVPSKACGLARGAQPVEAADRQRHGRRPRRARAARAPCAAGRQADAGDAAGMPGKNRHQRARQADRLEIVAAAIGADDRDAHLGHDLQQALVDRLLVAPQAVVRAARSPNRPRRWRSAIALLRQVGVDRGGADADQHGEVVHVQAFGRAHVDRGEGAQALAHEVECTAPVARIIGMATRPGAHRLVGQDDVLQPRARRPRPPADARDGVAQRRWRAAGCDRQGAVDLDRDLRPCSRIASNSALVSTGFPARARRSGRLVLVEDVAEVAEPRRSVITRRSRSGSIGGLVTWLKFCRKKWCRPR